MEWHFLDHAAGSPARPEVVAAMVPLLDEGYGNPSGGHALARQARAELDGARERLAAVAGCRPGEVVFTSGGTEANDLAIRGVLDAHGGTVVGSAVEHAAVLQPVARAGGRTVAVDGRGRVDLDALGAALDHDVTLVSVILVNNEVGTIQDLAAVADVVRSAAPGALLHTDASQALSWVDLAEHAAMADLVTLASHKCGGPKGVGALVVREGAAVQAQVVGGGQERGRRAGTPNVASAVGFAVAAELAAGERSALWARSERWREQLVTAALAVPGAIDTAAPGGTGVDHLVPGIVHLCLPEVDSEALLFLLEQDHRVLGAAGSSCSSGAATVSGVPIAMGVAPELARGAVRLSFGWSTSDADVAAAVAGLPEAAARLRSHAAGRSAGMTDRVLVAMSGGVDSSVAVALLLEAGHDVVGVTLKLWGGESDRGCCSVADVDDARSVARRLGIDHHVFNFGDDFDTHVVEPYVADLTAGRTPNPCIECNRHLKFDRLLRRADVLGFDQVATGHHARIVDGRVARGADADKDQSYVLHMLGPDVLRRIRFPVGGMTKADVRVEAARLGLVTVDKPDSQDVCFITASGGRTTFLGDRIEVRPATVVDRSGAEVGHVDAIELVTLGQRKGLGLPGGGPIQYVTHIDVARQIVTVGDEADLLVSRVELDDLVWTDGVVDADLLAQSSAHGVPRAVTVDGDTVVYADPIRRVAPGQSVVLYAGDQVVASGIAR